MADLYSAMYSQPYECCMDKIGLIVLIEFIVKLNKAINKYFVMQSKPKLPVCCFDFFFSPLAELSSRISP